MEQVPAAAHAASGAIGGSMANLLLYPLDVVTVRLQIQRDIDTANATIRKQLQEAGAPQSEIDGVGLPASEEEMSIAAMFKKILKEEGPGAFFEGIGDDLVATATQSFLYFFVYDYLRNKQIRYYMKKRGFAPRTLGIRRELFFGAVAGMFCKLFTTPIKNVVILKQIDHKQHKTVGQCVKEIYDHKGITGLWSGYRATFFLSANPSLSYYFYQLLGSDQKSESSARVFARAAIAKSLATLMTYPVILAKTRTQAKQGPSDLYKDLWKTFKHHGIAGLYDGVDAQLLKGCFSQGITMTTKESISQCVVYIYIHFVVRNRKVVIR